MDHAPILPDPTDYPLPLGRNRSSIRPRSPENARTGAPPASGVVDGSITRLRRNPVFRGSCVRPFGANSERAATLCSAVAGGAAASAGLYSGA